MHSKLSLKKFIYFLLSSLSTFYLGEFQSSVDYLHILLIVSKIDFFSSQITLELFKFIISLINLRASISFLFYSVADFKI